MLNELSPSEALFVEVAVPVPIGPELKFFDYKVPEDLRSKIFEGSLLSVPFGARKTWGIAWRLKSESKEPKLKSIGDVLYDEPLLDAERRKLAEYLALRYFYPIGEVCESVLPAAVRKASKKLLLQVPKEKKVKDKAEPFKVLNPNQEKAVDDFFGSSKKAHLLWGVTGSGKTEVYLRLIKEF